MGRPKVLFKAEQVSNAAFMISASLRPFELSPRSSLAIHLWTLASHPPNNLSLCSLGPLTELTVVLSGRIHQAAARPAVAVR